MKLFKVPAGTPALLFNDRTLKVWSTEGERTFEREELVLDEVILHNNPNDWNYIGLGTNAAAILVDWVGKMHKMAFLLNGNIAGGLLLVVDRSHVEYIG